MVYYSDEEDESSSSEAFEEPDDIPGRPQSRRMVRSNADARIYNFSRSVREPHVLQWAVNTTVHPQQAGSHVIAPNSILHPDTIRAGNSGNSSSNNRDSISSIANSNCSYIAKMFAVTVREVTDLLVTLASLKKANSTKSRSDILPIDDVNLVDLQEKVNRCLSQSWRWIVDVMDNTESQLRFGVSLLLATDKKHPMHPLNPDYQQKLISSSRRDRSSNREPSLWDSGYRRARLEANNLFASSRHDVLIYALSLMRSNNYEHRDTIPFMDISSMKHAAYVFDAFMYFLRHTIGKLSSESENCVNQASYELSNQSSSAGVTVGMKEVSAGK